MRRAGIAAVIGVAVIVVGGCARPGGAAPASLRADAVIEGRVRDRDTGGPLAGATLVATRATSDQQAGTAITDEEGRYRMVLPPGHFALTVYYADEVVERSIELRAGDVRALELRVVKPLVDPEVMWRSLECAPDPRAAPATRADEDALIAAALADHAPDAPHQGDGPSRAEAPTAYVYATLRDGRALSARALPNVAGIPYQLQTEAALQARADQAGAPVGFLRVHSVEIVGDCGAIEVAWSVAIPARDVGMGICRCSGVDLYARRAGRWVLEQVGNETCGG